MGRFGITEILLILGVALLLFGGTRIASIGKGLGDGIKNFKKGLKDDDEDEPKRLEGAEGTPVAADDKRETVPKS
jgi:sec-independent protein translocase protein TatA